MSLSYFHDHLGSVWYHSEPSRRPLFPKPVTIFFCFLQQTDSSMCVLDKGQQILIICLNQINSIIHQENANVLIKKISSSKFLMSPPLSVGIFMQSPECAATHMIPTLPVNLEIMLQRINKTKHLFS